MGNSSIKVHFGGSVFGRFKDLNYTLWYAVAEFIDNSTHSYFQHEKEIKSTKGSGLEVDIIFKNKEILQITDNAYGMNRVDLQDLVEVARPKENANIQRSEFGMGLKTGGFWLGKKIEITTKKLNEKNTLKVVLDLNRLVNDDFEFDVVETTEHDEKQSFTIIKITEFHRSVSHYAVSKTKGILESMYALDIRNKKMKLTWNLKEVEPYERKIAVVNGAEKKWDINLDINGKKVVGFMAALAKGNSGRANAGVSISRNGRNINNKFNWWKPEVIFGEGESNTLVNQRIFGELEFDKKFGVSQTKDKIHFEGEDEDKLMSDLKDVGIELINFAKKTKQYYGAKKDDKGGIGPETEEDIQEELNNLNIDSIINDKTIINDGEVEEEINEVIAEATTKRRAFKFKVGDSAIVRVWLKDDALDDKYVMIHNKDLLDLKIVINVLHPAYERMELLGDELALKEYMLQCVYDALSECFIYMQSGETKINPNSFREIKDRFLRLRAQQAD